MNEIEALTILTLTQGLGSIKTKRLLQHFGSALNTLNAPREALALIPCLSHLTLKHWDWWKQDRTWEKNLELAETQSVNLIPYNSPQYPKALLQISDHPILLYVKGRMIPEDQQSIAVVGTRQPTVYGREMSEKISLALASNGFTIVSGLARGIDTAAHRGALRTGRTIAVIGSGLANLYPKENQALAEDISKRGAVISEFPMSTAPDRHNFPRRNRIVSGMTQGTLLIEAPKKSGAMITVQKGREQKKPIWTIPGRADIENFEGNHQLIKMGHATLVSGAEDILQSYDNTLVFKDINTPSPIQSPNLEPEEKKLLHLLEQDEFNIDEIVKLTKLPVMKINILLMSLIMKKRIKEYPGKVYRKSIASQ